MFTFLLVIFLFHPAFVMLLSVHHVTRFPLER